ncbi:MAG: T9SS type A sorting domain-containing protein, partial [Bacteroidales bacterium]|nr:T9SS type A sorting domain-containing protein [Bacteroidales bacterium]
PWPENPVTIQEPEPLAFADVMVSGISCHNEEDGEIEITAQGGTDALSYSIDDGSNWESANSFDNLEPEQYNLWLKDANGCTTEYADNPITLENPEALEVSINAQPGLEAPVGDTVELSASTNYFVNYNWQPGGEETASIEVTSDEAGEEECTVTVTNTQGCVATASETLVFFVPTGMGPVAGQAKVTLMPNPTDGKFIVRLEGISSAVDFTVFDATGNRVVHKVSDEPARGIIKQPFNFSNRANGLYYIKVTTDSGKWVKKLILQH